MTGGIACGKTTVAHALRVLGAPVLDADVLSRETTANQGPALPAIEAAFGKAVFQAEGVLDRQALAQRVFGDATARKTLEAIIHPLVHQGLLTRLAALEAQDALAAVLDIPLLYEAGMDSLANEVWVVYLPVQEQLRRLMARDGLEEAPAQARIASQMPLAEKLRRADVILPTCGPRAQVAQRVALQWARVMEKVRLC